MLGHARDEALGCDRGGSSAKQEGPGWLSTAPAGGVALHTAARQSRGAGGRGKGLF